MVFTFTVLVIVFVRNPWLLAVAGGGSSLSEHMCGRFYGVHEAHRKPAQYIYLVDSTEHLIEVR